ncbi:MAG: AAA family ATPase [Ruminococcus flavefaciens]|nr:AAA family ATPase [Ruminococcus flavefaciens]
MASIFNKTSTRMFCISGELSDIFCMPNGVIMNFDELLVYRLHKLGYKNVVFCSSQRNMLYAIDFSGSKAFEMFLPERKKNKSASETDKPIKVDSSYIDYLDDDEDDDDDEELNEQFIKANTQKENIKIKYTHKLTRDTIAVATNRFMTNTDDKKALVFTSLEDLIKLGSTEDGRKLLECFEDWKALTNENHNICIFLSKTLDSAGLQNLLQENHASVIESLFLKNAEFNSNACLNIGSPMNDEISSLLELLRLEGHSYKLEDGTVFRTYLRFHRSEKTQILRTISFCNRDSGYTQLKIIKEILENFMESRKTAVVWLTADDIKKCYPQSSSNFDDTDPMELLKSREGWESAYHVLKSFVMNYKGLYSDSGSSDNDTSAFNSEMNIDRFEPNCNNNKPRGKAPNFVLQGPPGVGKTEIANLIGRILQREGVLKSGHTVIGSRDRLVGEYVGSTAIKTASLIEEAQEGVLLVDEVYSLAEKRSENSNSFCDEVFNTIVAAMTNSNYHFCVIFAGYANEMHKVWKMNEGLLSRFSASNVITLNEYQPALLQKIFTGQFGKPEGISGQITTLSEDVIEGLPVFFENYFSDRDRKNFGNARDINNLVAEVKRSASYRHLLELENRKDSVSHEEWLNITVEREDFESKSSLFTKRGFSASDIYAQLYEYEGLEFLAEMFNDQLSVRVECMEKNLQYPGPSHMIWAGNPGTGKSTAAQLTADLYHTLGILGGTEPIYIDASEILSTFHGGSADNMRQKMDEACQKNAVLVIEEAYQLINPGGKEAIDAMLNRMETDRSEFTIILILYKDKVKSFLDINAGIASRVKIYYFPDYDANQLYSIFIKMCTKSSDTVSDDCAVMVKKYLEKLYNSGESKNGNARLVRQLHEKMKQLRYRRITGEMAVDIYGADTPENRNNVSAARAMGKVSPPENAYIFTADDVPDFTGYPENIQEV